MICIEPTDGERENLRKVLFHTRCILIYDESFSNIVNHGVSWKLKRINFEIYMTVLSQTGGVIDRIIFGDQKDVWIFLERENRKKFLKEFV